MLKQTSGGKAEVVLVHIIKYSHFGNQFRNNLFLFALVISYLMTNIYRNSFLLLIYTDGNVCFTGRSGEFNAEKLRFFITLMQSRDMQISGQYIQWSTLVNTF